MTMCTALTFGWEVDGVRRGDGVGGYVRREVELRHVSRRGPLPTTTENRDTEEVRRTG